MQLYEAIWRRKSTRNYSPEPLSTQQRDVVQQSIQQAEQLQHAPPVQIHTVLDGNRVQQTMLGLVGAYGKVRSPHYLIASAVPSDNYLENIGYVLEQVVLNLTKSGIGTCWIGAHLNQQPVQGLISLQSDHVPVLLVAYGLPANPAAIWRNDTKEFKRKPMSALMLSSDEGSWQNYLEAARLAPSAVNSQPWRFQVESKDVLHVFQAKGGILTGKHLYSVNRVDMGIALCHINLAADAAGQAVSFEHRAAQNVAGCTYCISVVRSAGA